jgi:hypothetical protein
MRQDCRIVLGRPEGQEHLEDLELVEVYYKMDLRVM